MALRGLSELVYARGCVYTAHSERTLGVILAFSGTRFETVRAKVCDFVTALLSCMTVTSRLSGVH
jgi:hypothetical protein